MEGIGMKRRKLSIMVMAAMFVMTWAPTGFGAVSPEDAAKLGTTLTGVGAEKAGNKEGTIPPFTGGLAKLPANFKPGSGVYTDPFAGEKPLFSINAQNMAQYADKLTEGTKALMKKYPTYRIDIYKTHRIAEYPDFVIKNTAKNAVKATTANGGLSVRDARGGIPFPIPKTGYEVMWNHLLRYEGTAIDAKWRSFLVDAGGRITMVQDMVVWFQFPYYEEEREGLNPKVYYQVYITSYGPPRKAGEKMLLLDMIDPYENPRIVYQYLPGQRRVKLAPEVGFDTPDSGTAGSSCYDDNFLFIGSMERFEWKLIGKKEMYVPYNCYKAVWEAKREELYHPKHFNPDVVRWELHRVWVVEGTLRSGKRHVYSKRRYYIDEDSWVATAGDIYDQNGTLYRAGYLFNNHSYDINASNPRFFSMYDLVTGIYSGICYMGEGGYVREVKPHPSHVFTPGYLTGAGIR
jgi:hypothetical protein